MSIIIDSQKKYLDEKLKAIESVLTPMQMEIHSIEIKGEVREEAPIRFEVFAYKKDMD